MSRSIDERIVEMRFDNKQFESGIKESLTSLTKLDEVLKKNISSKSLDDISKAASNINISGLSKAIDTINSRFSTMGIATMRIIENITDGLINGLGNAIKTTTDSIVSGGIKRAMNIENAHFQLQGLISDEKEVQAIMQQANDSVDGTAYSYDVAAKAASMFAATGIKSGHQMETALKGIAGVAATTNADYERVSNIFTTISGQGRIMGDQLNQFANMGMNAAAALTNYMNGVNDGTAEASDAVKSYIAEITGGVQITEADLRDMVSDSKISFDLFAEAMGQTFGDHAKDANKTFTGAMANIRAALARTGAMFISPLISQDGEFVQFFNAIRIKVNEFNKALGASNGLAQKFTTWVRKIVSHLTEIVENFNVANTYVRVFGDGVEKTFESAHRGIQNFGDGTQKVVDRDFYTPFHALQDIIYTVINVFKGLYSVVKPVGEAFHDVFLETANAGDIYKLVENIRKLSEGFRLSTEHSEQLKTAFTGIFSVVKSIVDIFVRLVKAINPNIDASNDLGDSIFDLIGWIGELLIGFSNWLDESPEVEKVITTLGKGISTTAEIIAEGIRIVVDWLKELDIKTKISDVADKINQFKESVRDAIPEPIKNIWDGFIDSLSKLSEIDLGKVIQSVKDFVSSIFGISDSEVETSYTDTGKFAADGFIKGLGEKISEVIAAAKEIGLKALEGIKEFLGIASPSKEFEEVGKFSVEGFIKGITDKLSGIKDAGILIGSKILDGLSESIYLLISVASGGALTYLLINIGKGFSSLAKLFSTSSRTLAQIPGLLNSIKKEVNASAKEAKANAFYTTMKGIALGIAVITTSLVVLMKTTDDPAKLMAAGIALGAAVGIIVLAIEHLLNSAKKMKTTDRALNLAAEGLKSSLKNLGKAVKIKAITSGIKDIAIAIGIIIADIAGIMYLYDKDKEGFENALKIVGEIAAVIVGIMAVLSILGQVVSNGMTAASKVMAGVLALSIAVLISIKALKDVMDLELGTEEEVKRQFGVLTNLFILVGGLAVAVGLASRLAGDGGLKATVLLSMCLVILATTHAVKEIMGIDLPMDWEDRMSILYGMFTALGLLIITIGAANKLAGGGIKAATSILAICGFIAVIIAAITVLAIFPAEKLKQGAIALGGILLILAGIMSLVGLTLSKNGGSGATAILAMALDIAAIAVALSFLSGLDTKSLKVAALALGGILITLALVFAGVGQITNEEAYVTVITMIGLVAAVVVGLAVLSKVDSWETLIASAVSMSMVLLAIAKCFQILAESKALDLDQIMDFLLGLIGVAAIAAVLRLVSNIPWDTMLAAGASISAVLLSIAETFKILNSIENISNDSIIAFIGGCLGVALIGWVLGNAAGAPWDSLLGLGGSIAATLLAIGVCFKIMSSIDITDLLGTIALFATGVAGVCLIGKVIADAAKQPWQNLLAAGISISVVILAMSLAMLLASAAGALAPEATLGIALLDAFIADLTAVLVALGALTKIPGFNDLITAGGGILSQIGKALGDFVGSIIEGIGEGIGKALEAIGISLSKFMVNATPFFIGLKMIDKDTLAAAKALAGVVLALSVAGFIDGISNLFSLFTGKSDMGTFGTKLVTFGEAIRQFDMATRGIDGTHVKLVSEAAKYLIDISKYIPNTGGLLAKITGDNDIGKFGLSLAAFGSSIAVFDISTRSITDPGRFKQLSEGMGYLFDVAKRIPNSGGLLSKVTGDNDIGKFGSSLNTFGYWWKSFDIYTKNISESNRMKELSIGMGYLFNVAKKIPNNGGLASIFSGDNDIGKFGSALNTFGYWWKSFNIYTQNIDPERMKYLAIAIEELVDTCKKIEKVDNNSLKNFGETLSNMAKDGLKSFINVFIANTPKALATVKTSVLQINNSINGDVTMQTAFKGLATRSINTYNNAITDLTITALNTVKTLLKKITDVMKDADKDYKAIGDNHAKLYIAAIAAQYKNAETTGITIAKKTKDGIESLSKDFTSTGDKLASDVIKGFKKKTDESAEDAGKDFLKKLKGVFDNIYDDFKKLGEDAGDGFTKGLDNKVSDAADKARDLAKEARKAIEDELNIQSPSKVLRKDGNYAGEGFVLGMLDWVKNVKKAGSELGRSAIDGIDTAITALAEEIDPTITPIVDLTNVMEAADEINAMFSEALANVDGSVTKASTSMAARQETVTPNNNQNENGNAGTNVTFNQYNNSPKALSRIDIYRQTRNQLAQFREAVSTT